MHGLAKDNTHCGTGDAQNGDAPEHIGGERRSFDGEPGGRDVKELRYTKSGERGGQTWDKSGVVDDADADDLEREDGGSERRAEEGGKEGAHAAERGEAHILIVKTEEPAHAPAETAADLEGSALAACGASAQVCQDGGGEDDWDERQGDLFTEVYGVYDGVGTLAFEVCVAVDERDEHADDGQQPEQPGEALAQTVGAVYAQVEGGADEPTHSPRDGSDGEPFYKGAQESSGGAEPAGQFFGQVENPPKCGYADSI